MTKPMGSKSGRRLWAPGGVRLFDPAGEEYDRLDHDASRVAIEEAVSRNAAEVVIADCSAPLQWHTGVDARRAWTRHSKDFNDVEDWKPPRGAHGTLPYQDEIWRGRQTGKLVVVLAS